MMSTTIIIILAVIVFIAILLGVIYSQDSPVDDQSDKQTGSIRGENGNYLVKYDMKRKLVGFKVKGNYKIYKFSDILQCEVMEDGATTMKQSTTGAIGRGLLGGLLAGGAGAIIGGVTTRMRVQEKIYEVSLRVIINDHQFPCFTLQCLNSPFGTSKRGFDYDSAIKAVQYYYSIFSGIISQGEQMRNIENGMLIQNAHRTPDSIPDTLMKWKSLLDSGIITEEEFQTQKMAILNNKASVPIQQDNTNGPIELIDDSFFDNDDDEKRRQAVKEEINSLMNRGHFFCGYYLHDSLGLKFYSEPFPVQIDRETCNLVLGIKNHKLWVGIFDMNKDAKFTWQGQDDFDLYRENHVDSGITSNFQVSWFDIKYCNIVDDRNFQIVTYSYTGVSSMINPGVFDIFFVCDGKLKVIAGNRGVVKRNITSEMKFEKYGDNGIMGWRTVANAKVSNSNDILYYDKNSIEL